MDFSTTLFFISKVELIEHIYLTDAPVATSYPAVRATPLSSIAAGGHRQLLKGSVCKTILPRLRHHDRQLKPPSQSS